MSETIRIAIQKSGRLSEDSLRLIKECGIRFDNGAGKLKTTATNFPAEILFLRDDDIPGYVEDGVAHLGIIGQNVADESGRDVEVVHNLGFSKCRLSIGTLREVDYRDVQDLAGKSIATSYPRLLGKFLADNNVEAHIHEISGSVEIAPSIGLADAVCDIVSSGSTLLSNGLKEVEVIYRSEAILVANKNLSGPLKDLLSKLLFRINAVQAAKNNKYILLNCPKEAVNDIMKYIPGMKAPTIIPLATEGWCSLHSVINENDFWVNIEKLRELGAEGILVVPIEKMIV
jgi:ATP phosphoribosyltransferase